MRGPQPGYASLDELRPISVLRFWISEGLTQALLFAAVKADAADAAFSPNIQILRGWGNIGDCDHSSGADA